jgi:hypothetical protein
MCNPGGMQVYGMLVGKLHPRQLMNDQGMRWEGNTKMNFREIDSEDVNWI